MNQSPRPSLYALLGFALALLLPGIGFAATYNIGLLEGATGTGNGQFTFTNNGTTGSFPVTASLSTNASSGAGARNFTAGGALSVVVAAVNFNDDKTAAPDGANDITGNYVEGLMGSLETVPTSGLTQTGNCNQGTCFYRITFAYGANANPNLATKSYLIQLYRINPGNGNQIAEGVAINGTYSVRNTASPIPEPGSLALMGIGLIALAWLGLRRRPNYPAAV